MDELLELDRIDGLLDLHLELGVRSRSIGMDLQELAVNINGPDLDGAVDAVRVKRNRAVEPELVYRTRSARSDRQHDQLRWMSPDRDIRGADGVRAADGRQGCRLGGQRRTDRGALARTRVG